MRGQRLLFVVDIVPISRNLSFDDHIYTSIYPYNINAIYYHFIREIMNAQLHRYYLFLHRLPAIFQCLPLYTYIDPVLYLIASNLNRSLLPTI